MKKVILGISGASGVELASAFIEYLPSEIGIFIIGTRNAHEVAKRENSTLLLNSDVGAIAASGSFCADAMAIVPCSMNSLAKIACGISDNLLTRTASVMLKERRTLLLAPREMPFSTISLENMQKLSLHGVLIAPPVVAYYAKPQTLEDMQRFFVGKWFDLLGVGHNLFKRWEG